MADWRIKDYRLRCYNIQNRLTPYSADEAKLVSQMKKIRKEKKCDELTAWKILKHRLTKELLDRSEDKSGK